MISVMETIVPYLHYLLWITISSLFFTTLNRIFKEFLPENVVRHGKEWLWRNTAVSCIHSVITGVVSMICLYSSPKLGADLIGVTTQTSEIIVCISLGYFIYDTGDIWFYNRNSRSCVELLVHHAVLITCFVTSLWQRLYFGFCSVALFVEVNSIFLHLRQLLLLVGMSKNHSVYRLNGVFNLGTYIVCRILTCAWMARWLIHHRDEVALITYSLATVGLCIIIIMNIVLLWRLLRSDHLPNAARQGQKDD